MIRNQNERRESRMGRGTRALATIIMLILLNAACTKFQTRHVAYDSLSIVILDRSRIDNLKIRHILQEFLLKKIIDKGAPWLAVFDTDTSQDYPGMRTGYCVIFDIMEYAADIEKGELKILASAKVVKLDSNIIAASFIECKEDGSIEKVCETLAEKLAADVVKEMSGLRRIRMEIPEVTCEPQDSLEKK